MLDQREDSNGIEVAERPIVNHGARRPEFVVRGEPGPDAARRAQGLKNCASGAILVSIGFAFGGSVFLGNPGPLDWVFDSLGTFWVGKGLWEIFRA